MDQNASWIEFLEDFCKSDFQYNDSYYANSTFPNFTPCFQYTVLTSIPAIFLFILAPIFTFKLEWLGKRRELQPLPCSFLTTIKFALTTTLFSSSLLIFLHYFVSWNRNEGQVYFWYPLIRVQTCAYITHMQRRLNRLGHTSSGILFNSTLLLFICAIPEVRSWIERIVEHQLEGTYNLYTCIIFWVWYLSLALYLMTLCWADKRSQDETIDVLEQPNYSFLNQISMFWMGSFLGAKGLRQRGDLVVMDQLERALPLYREWNKLWQPRFKRFGRQPAQKPSVSSTLFAMFKWQLVGSGWLRLIGDLLQFVVPFVLLVFVPLLNSNEYRLWKSVSLAVLLFVSQQIRYFIINYISLVSNQTLRLTTTSNKDDQELQYLLTHDIKAIQRFFRIIHFIWSPFLQLSLIFFIFYVILYITALPIIFLTILLIIGKFCTLSNTDSSNNNNSNHIRLINEVLNGIRTIKLRVWEQPLQRRLNEYRESEARNKVHQNFINLLGNGSSLFAPLPLILITVCLTFSNRLPSIHIFIVVYLIYQLCGPLDEIQQILSAYLKYRSSAKNIQQFLLSEQVDKRIDVIGVGVNIEGIDSTVYDIQIQGAYFSINHQIPLATLIDVNLNVKRGELVAVVGEDVTQCKNFLLSLIGELKRLEGVMHVNKSIGYVPTKPWIMNSSINENIEFQAEKNQELYEKIIETCDLRRAVDFELHNRDDFLNESLSQSHKTLIGLARALYQQPDVYLFEDILSQLDNATSNRIFHQVIQALLANKTRLFMTNNLEYIRQSDSVIYINGPSLNSGSFTQLSTSNPDFEQFVRNLELHSDHQIATFNVDPPLASTSQKVVQDKDVVVNEKAVKERVKPVRVTWEDSYRRSTDGQLIDEDSPLLLDEDCNVQQFKVYWHFFRSLALTPQLFGLFALPFLIALIEVLKNLWFVDWMDNDWKQEGLDGHFPLILRLSIFICSGLLEVAMFVLALYLITLTGSKLTTTVYGRFIGRVFDAPMAFFTQENRAQLAEIFNYDLPTFDSKIPSSIGILSMASVYVFVMLVIKVAVNPLAIVFIIPVVSILAYHMIVYTRAVRQLHRMKVLSQKPIITHFLQTYKGASTIRAFNKTRNCAWLHDELLDLQARISKTETFVDHWMKIRMWTVTNWFIFLTFLSIILLHHWGFGLSSNWIALMLALVLNLPQFIQIMNAQIKRLATQAISTNKLRKMELIEMEVNLANLLETAPNDWPDRGAIRFINLSTYKQFNNSFLQNLTVDVNTAQQTLIIGNEESGKGDIVGCLFRLIEPAGGQILIDDVDIQKLNLKDIRKHIAIIPENPLLLSETLRFNLDPASEFSDDHLWTVLRMVNLDTVISSKWSNSLSHKLDVYDDLTVRQKWLFDLARVLLRPSKVLIIEEASKEIDQGTTTALFEVIRREVAGSTTLIIAPDFKSTIHRDISVLLLENGELKGYDLPHRLLNDGPSTSHGPE